MYWGLLLSFQERVWQQDLEHEFLTIVSIQLVVAVNSVGDVALL